MGYMRISIAAVVIACIAAHVNGAPMLGVDEKQVAQWLEQAMKSAAEPLKLGECSIEWQREVHYTPPMDEILRMREEVRGKPEHPALTLLAQYEQRLAGRPEIHGLRVWYRGRSEWRVCLDFGAGKQAAYWDKASTRSHCWTLQPDTLAVAGNAAGFPGQTIDSTEHQIQSEIGAMAHGGLASLSKSNYQVKSVYVDRRSWIAELSRTFDGVEYLAEVRGTWDEQLSRGFVDSVQTRSASSELELVIAQDWRDEPTAGCWLAHRVEIRDGAGKLMNAYQIVAVRPSSAEEFEQLTRIPAVDGNDPLRGASTFTRFVDYRSEMITEKAAHGGMNSTVMYAQSDRSIWQRWIGWAVAGMLVLGFLLIVARRKLVARG